MKYQQRRALKETLCNATYEITSSIMFCAMKMIQNNFTWCISLQIRKIINKEQFPVPMFKHLTVVTTLLYVIVHALYVYLLFLLIVSVILNPFGIFKYSQLTIDITLHTIDTALRVFFFYITHKILITNNKKMSFLLRVDKQQKLHKHV